jgi:hypothetical protein
MNIDKINALAEKMEHWDEIDGIGQVQGFEMGDFACRYQRGEENLAAKYGVHWANGHKCGTAGCIAGCAVAMQYPYREITESAHIAEEAEEILELTCDQAIELFMPSSTSVIYSGPGPYDITPQQAARVLRHLAATGEVDWNKAFEKEIVS